MSTDQKKRSILGAIGRVIVAPIAAPFRWIKRDYVQQKEVLRDNLTNAIDRNKKLFRQIEDRAGLTSTDTRDAATRLQELQRDEKITNLLAIKNRWRLYVAAYFMSVLSILFSIINGNLLMFASSSVWAAFFWLHASRLAWSSHRIAQSLSGINDGQGFREWIKRSWKSNLPLPPAYSEEITFEARFTAVVKQKSVQDAPQLVVIDESNNR